MNRAAGIVRRCLANPWAWTAILLIPSASIPWEGAWDGDAASYGIFSIQLWNTLSRQPLHWIRMLFQASPDHAPGIYWVGEFFTPIGHLIGGVESGLLLSTLVWQAITLLSVYFAAFNELGTVTAAVAASLFAAGTPIFLWMSGHYFQEPMQTAGVAAFFWGTTVVGRLDWRRGTVLLVALVTLMLLSKISTPFYVLAPAVLLLRRLRDAGPPAEKRWKRKDIAIASIVGAFALACAAWYLMHLSENIAYVKAAGIPGPGIYGHPLPPSAKLRIWLGMLRGAFTGSGAWALVACLGLAFGTRSFCAGGWRARRGDGLFLASWVQIGIFLFAFSHQYSEEFRYIYPLLVPLSLIVGWTLAQWPGWSFGAAVSAVLAVQLNFAVRESRAHPVHQGVDWSTESRPSDYQLEGMKALVSIACRDPASSGNLVLGERRALDRPLLRFYSMERSSAPEASCGVSRGPETEGPDQAAARLLKARPALFATLRPDLLAKEADGTRLISILERVRRMGGIRMSLPQYPELELYRFP